MASTTRTERLNTVIVGAGQAGLSVAYHLQRRGVPFELPLRGPERPVRAHRAGRADAHVAEPVVTSPDTTR